MCVCLWPEFDCPEVTLCGWQDIKIQLLLLLTALACQMSWLKSACVRARVRARTHTHTHTHICHTECLLFLQQVYFQRCAFWCESFLMQGGERGEGGGGGLTRFKISVLLVVFKHGSERVDHSEVQEENQKKKKKWRLSSRREDRCLLTEFWILLLLTELFLRLF